MKKLMILLAVVFFGALSAHAQKETDLVISAGNAKSIVLGNNMKVVFVPVGAPNDVKISSDAMNKLHISYSNNALILEPRKQLMETVYVLVKNPASVMLGENTVLTTDGFLQGNMDLHVNFGASAKVHTAGKIKVYPVGDTGIRVERTVVGLNASAAIE